MIGGATVAIRPGKGWQMTERPFDDLLDALELAGVSEVFGNAGSREFGQSPFVSFCASPELARSIYLIVINGSCKSGIGTNVTWHLRPAFQRSMEDLHCTLEPLGGLRPGFLNWRLSRGRLDHDFSVLARVIADLAADLCVSEAFRQIEEGASPQTQAARANFACLASGKMS